MAVTKYCNSNILWRACWINTRICSPGFASWSPPFCSAFAASAAWWLLMFKSRSAEEQWDVPMMLQTSSATIPKRVSTAVLQVVYVIPPGLALRQTDALCEARCPPVISVLYLSCRRCIRLYRHPSGFRLCRVQASNVRHENKRKVRIKNEK